MSLLTQMCIFSAGGGVHIGDNVTLSYGTTILTAGLDTNDYIRNSKMKYRKHIQKSVRIGKGTWIAANVTICPGAVIPEDSIVAAGSVVVGTLKEEKCLYGGIPAYKIKSINKKI